MAKMTKEQAIAIMKLQQAQIESDAQSPDTSWWDNLKNEASDMGSGLVAAAKDPGDALMGMLGLGAGGLEAGVRYMAPGLGEAGDRFNNMVAEYTNNTLAKPREVGKRTPVGDAAAEMASDTYNSFRHPIDSFYERPINTTLDWGGAVGGLIGKLPGVVKKAGALTPADEVLELSKKAKDDAFTAAYAHPQGIDTGAIRDAAIRAANDAGYNPDRLISEPNRVAVTDITKNYDNTGTVRDVHQMRQTADMVDARPTVKAPGLGADNPIAAAMKDAIDSGLEKTDPEAFALLKKAFDLNSRYKNTQTILDLRNKADLTGRMSPNAAKAVGTEVRRVALDKGAVRGLGEETAADLSHVVDMVKPAGNLARIRDEIVSNLPVAAGGLGFLTPIGPAGALLGAAAGTGIKHFLSNARNAKTAKMMSEELLIIANELNNLPRGEMIKKFGMMKLSPQKRAALAATLGIPTSPEEFPAGR